MKATLYIYRLFNYLSFDVACGAMVCATFFAHILHVQMIPYGLASLGLTVWIIYTIDHLLDVRKLKREASSKRHRFHQKNLWTLLTFLIIAILIDLSLILLIRKPILIWGIGLALVVVLYLCFQQRLILFKELVVSLLYSSGILLPAMSLTRMVLSVDEIILISFFTLTAFINLILFSWYDWKQDIRDNHPSLVTFFGRKTSPVSALARTAILPLRMASAQPSKISNSAGGSAAVMTRAPMTTSPVEPSSEIGKVAS